MILVMLAIIAVLLFFILRVVATKDAPASESARLSAGQQKFVAVAQLVVGGLGALWIIWMISLIFG